MRSRTLPVLVAAASLMVLALASPLAVTIKLSYRLEAGVTTAVVEISIEGAPNATYGVEVQGPSGELVAVKEVDTDENGLAVLILEIPDTFPHGTYTVYVSGEGENATATFEINWEAPGAEEEPVKEVPVGGAAARRGVAAAALNLFKVAAKLSRLVHCRNEVLATANVTQTEHADTYQTILELTARGDTYLSLANSSITAANYTAALRYAQEAIRNYGKALELQELVKDLLNLSFAACKVVLAPVEPPRDKGPAVNRTCKWSPEFYPMMTAFNVTERRIEELEKLIARAAEQGYNVSGILSLLEKARSLVEEGRSLAVACNESAAAHRLAEAKKLLGLANAELAKLGARRLAKEMVRRGVEVNETETEEVVRAVRNGRALEKISELINRTLNRIRERVEREARIEGEEATKLAKRLQKLDELLEKLPQREIPSRAREVVEKARETARKVKEEIPRKAAGKRP